MTERLHEPHQKASAINRDRRLYGTIAEIGAGQETARWFFRVGGAAGTIAKTMSAYDMTFSDAIYGPAPRYVCRERLRAMLDHEYGLLLERLDAGRGAETCFFAFANTVAARSFTRREDGHGWLGIRFQTRPREAPSQIEVHVNLHGRTNLEDQETLGTLGVNLIYGALMLHHDPEALLLSLRDKVYPEQAELDMVDFSGPAFDGVVDNRVVALRLVEHGMSDAAMFTADGRVAQVADVLWQRPVLVERSRFRPPTLLTLDLLEHARRELEQEVDPHRLVVLAEMTLRNLGAGEGEAIDTRDFLNRADILCALGMNVLVSSYGTYWRLAQYLFRYTRGPIGLAMGLPSLREIFEERYYDDLPGGILESFGRLFRHDLRLYVCPELDASGRVRTLEDFRPQAHLHHLFAYLRETGHIRPLGSVPAERLAIHSHEVLEHIRNGDGRWEAQVPPHVAEMIRARGLFGWRPAG